MAKPKYSMIKREDLKSSVMDRSESYRLKVEEQSMSQFHSNLSK